MAKTKSLGEGEIEVLQVDWHRNGIGGEGFYAVLFRWRTNKGVENFLGTLFDRAGQCAVVSLDRIGEHGVSFGFNSWRGDVVEDRLRKAIRDWPWTGRCGPFSLPTNAPAFDPAAPRGAAKGDGDE